MGPVEAISSGLRGIFDFVGEAPRSELFWMMGFGQLVQMFAIPIDAALVSQAGRLFLTPVVMIVWLSCMFAVTARRLNHMGYSGRWLRYTPLIGVAGLVAYVAQLVFGVAALTDGAQMNWLVLGPVYLAIFLMFPAWGAVVVTLMLSLFNAQRSKV